MSATLGELCVLSVRKSLLSFNCMIPAKLSAFPPCGDLPV
jgi:hypothetical protein